MGSRKAHRSTTTTTATHKNLRTSVRCTSSRSRVCARAARCRTGPGSARRCGPPARDKAVVRTSQSVSSRRIAPTDVCICVCMCVCVCICVPCLHVVQLLEEPRRKLVHQGHQRLADLRMAGRGGKRERERREVGEAWPGLCSKPSAVLWPRRYDPANVLAVLVAWFGLGLEGWPAVV
jgi:hypothetical protein